MQRSWSRLLTVAAGVLGAVACYGVLTHALVASGFVSGDESLLASKMISANIGAIAAALAVAAWPSDRIAPLFESLATWVVATVMLMAIAAPVQPGSVTADSGQDTPAIGRDFARR